MNIFVCLLCRHRTTRSDYASLIIGHGSQRFHRVSRSPVFNSLSDMIDDQPRIYRIMEVHCWLAECLPSFWPRPVRVDWREGADWSPPKLRIQFLPTTLNSDWTKIWWAHNDLSYTFERCDGEKSLWTGYWNWTTPDDNIWSVYQGLRHHKDTDGLVQTVCNLAPFF